MAEEKLTIEYNQLLIHPPRGKSLCKILVTESESDFGRLFGLIEFEAPKNRESSKILDDLVLEIENLYFQSTEEERIKAKFQSGTSSVEKFFECLLQKINLRVAQIQRDQISSQISKPGISKKINAVVALLSGNNLYLANSGQISSFLIYPVGAVNYKIIDILENAGRDQDETIFFSNIINGTIDVGSFLLFCTENLLDYFSLEKLKKTIITQPLSALSGDLESLFDETEGGRAFGALAIKLRPSLKKEEAQKIIQKEKPLPQTSINDLLATQSATEKMLTSSLRLNIKKNVSKLLNNLKNLTKQREFLTKITKAVKLLIYIPATALFHLLYFIFHFLSKSILLIFYTVLRQREKRNKTAREIKQNLNQYFSKFNLWFKALPRQSKILFITSIVFILLFTSSIAFLIGKQNNEIEVEAYNTKVAIIQEKKNAAEAGIIYGDEEKAKTLLLEAKTLAEELPENSRKMREGRADLLSDIQIELEKLQHVINVPDPILIADLESNDPQANTLGIFIADNSLYTFNSQNNFINKINLENKEIQSINLALGRANQLRLEVPKDKNSILFYHTGGLFEFNLNDKSGRTVEITLRDDQEIKDMDIYNQRLYLLDSKNNQIFKHAKTLIGYTRGSSWIKEDIDITNATSIAIDGAIYLAKSNGELLRFMAGYKEDFKTSIDPDLTYPLKTWTGVNSNYLYILESQRLVVIDKEGKLVAQYQGEKFDNLKDFVVVEEEKKIYLLNGNKIYGIAITHL